MSTRVPRMATSQTSLNIIRSVLLLLPSLATHSTNGSSRATATISLPNSRHVASTSIIRGSTSSARKARSLCKATPTSMEPMRTLTSTAIWSICAKSEARQYGSITTAATIILAHVLVHRSTIGLAKRCMSTFSTT